MSISISGSGGITGATTSYSFDQSVSIGGTLTYEDVTNIDSVGVITARQGLDTPTNLVLRTGGTERLRITSAGLVGIGEDNPETLLHLKASTAPVLTIQNTTNTSYTGIQFDRAADDTQFAIYSYDSSHSSQANNVQLYNYQSGAITLHTSSTERLRITSAGITSVTGSFAVNGNNYPTAGALSNRSMIINGAMTVAQRGTTGISQNGNNNYVVDRFKGNIAGQATITHSQETTGAPDGFQNWLKVVVTTADAALASNEYGTMAHYIEGYNFAQTRYGFSDAKAVTVSFKFKTNKAGVYCMIHRNNAANRNFLYEFTPVADGNWQTITYTVPGDTTGTWDKTTEKGWRWEFCIGNGTDFQSSTVGSWFDGTYYHSTPNQVNFLDSTSNELGITGVQVELGTKATPFEYRSIGDELARCQRYFNTSFVGAVSTTNTDNAGLILAGGSATAGTTTFIGTGQVQFPTSMRATPSITYYDLAAPRNVNRCHRHTYGVAGTNNSLATVNTPSNAYFSLYSGTGASATGIIFHYSAEAEL